MGPGAVEASQWLLDRLPEGCLLLGPDWSIRFINAAAARHLGLDQSTAAGRTLQQALPGVAPSAAFGILSACMASRSSRHFTGSLPGAPHDRLTFRVEPEQDGLLLRTWPGRPRLRQPLAPKRLAFRCGGEAARNPAETRLIETMNAGIHLSRLVRGPDGSPCDLRLIDCNRPFLRYFGFKKEDVVGRLHTKLWPGMDPIWLEQELKVATTGQPAHFQWASKASPLAWEVFVFCPAVDTVAICSILITEPGRREQALAGMGERLAARAAVLEASIQELDAFGCAIAHDLRAPIRHIAGFAELLELQDRANLSAQGRQCLCAIRTGSASLAELLDHLLLLSSSGARELRRERVDLNALLAELRGALTVETGNPGVRWEIHSLPAVQADPSLLREVFDNLLVNALKSTRDQPEPTIRISAQENAAEVILSIRDNGVGFDPRQAHRLFTIFQRPQEPPFLGSGLGLACVKRSIRRHGGRVWAEAPAEGGAVFHLALPRVVS